MAFVCTVRKRTWHADVFREGDSYTVLVLVGYDDQEDKNYFAQVGLSPPPGGHLEYYFHLIEVDGKTKAEYLYWSGKDVARFIGSEDRAAILDVALTATASLLDQVKPAVVDRCTYDEIPPERALEKHYRISKVFTECGYEVVKSNDYHGKRVWRAIRL
jgi:hypothetical protein